jgi:hypothetical protein
VGLWRARKLRERIRVRLTEVTVETSYLEYRAE